MFDLSGKSALVTGASGGIGGAIARVLHGAGAAVALSGTRRDALDALASQLGSRVAVLPCSLSDADAVVALPAPKVLETARAAAAKGAKALGNSSCHMIQPSFSPRARAASI